MALYHLEGFDHFESATDDSADNAWDEAPASASYHHTTSEAAARPSATAPAAAKKRGLVLDQSISASTTHKRYIKPGEGEVGPTIAFGFDLYLGGGLPASTLQLFEFRTGGLGGVVQFSVWIRATGQMIIVRGVTTEVVGAATLLAGSTWYNIQIKVLVHDSAGTGEIKINGTSDISSTGLDTKADASVDTINVFGIRGIGQFNTYMDNLYIGDDYSESLRVDTFLPTADGTHAADFTKSTGATQYGLLDDYSAIDGDTTYLQSSTVNHEYSETYPTLAAGQTIYGLCVVNVFENPDGGSINIKPLIRQGGTDYLGADEIAGPTDYKRSGECWDTDPDDAGAWTDAKVNSAEFGLKITS